eukprot:CAMPEP_0172892856 /NCGR_PEP_ID=MMETSP1075-20121228/147149_1 /TAXON_ID=2916 /ORGANISM="Ceratium fusus, Strain PA161109" /LENGTH=70 /DNA_ID=CAMNT_0013747605 /DNA_START=12 /DNA_END=224 /DNA_ORIENTATION=+
MPSLRWLRAVSTWTGVRLAGRGTGANMPSLLWLPAVRPLLHGGMARERWAPTAAPADRLPTVSLCKGLPV